MSKPLDKTELIRSAWLTALRQRGNRVADDQEACALMILEDVIGAHAVAGLTLTQVAQNAVALTENQAWEVIAMNDGVDCGPEFRFMARMFRGKKTFAQMADVIEGWFK